MTKANNFFVWPDDEWWTQLPTESTLTKTARGCTKYGCDTIWAFSLVSRNEKRKGNLKALKLQDILTLLLFLKNQILATYSDRNIYANMIIRL